LAFRDLREFITVLEHAGDMHRVSCEVDPELEITEIADRVVKSGGPALLFETVKGSPFPVLINAFGTEKRAARALGVEGIGEIAKRLTDLIPSDAPSGWGEKLGFLRKLKEASTYQPKKVKRGPSQEVVEEPGDLLQLPALRCWPKDGGRFLTLPLVATKDPHTGRQNMGMYRMQIFDAHSAGMHWHLHHDGASNYRRHQKDEQEMEVAVALGGDPSLTYAATAPLPAGVDELLFAGFLRSCGVEVVKAKTVDLWVPAHAEFVLEGVVSTIKKRREGPFGDHTGFYSLEDDYPVFELRCLTRREDAIYPATIVGKPVMEDYCLGRATERIFFPLIQFQLPEVTDIHFPAEGTFHNCVFVSIRKEYPGHARKVASALWGMGQMMFTKAIVVVEEDVDVQDSSEVAWIAFSNVDPERDIFFQRGPLDVLDHASPTPCYGSKVGIDATRKWSEEGHGRRWPERILMSDDVKERVSKRWKEYGLG
jgi:4-hydroxy-3-polyprenylbenzoate decarboxylase